MKIKRLEHYWKRLEHDWETIGQRLQNDWITIGTRLFLGGGRGRLENDWNKKTVRKRLENDWNNIGKLSNTIGKRLEN